MQQWEKQASFLGEAPAPIWFPSKQLMVFMRSFYFKSEEYSEGLTFPAEGQLQIKIKLIFHSFVFWLNQNSNPGIHNGITQRQQLDYCGYWFI